MSENKPKPPKINFDNCENFTSAVVVSGFLHNTDYIDDPLFIDAAVATLGLDDSTTKFEKKKMLIEVYAIIPEGTDEIHGFIMADKQFETM